MARAGLAPPLEVSWLDLLADAAALSIFDGCDLLRMDSWGEHPRVHDLMLRRGGAPASATLEFGELAFTKEAQRGFCLLLESLGSRRWLSQPSDVAIMFDKWECHRRFSVAGLPRPETRLLPDSLDAFHEQLPPRGRWFIKPLHGSSASGVCALQRVGGRLQLTAPIELKRQAGLTQLFNSLRIATYRRPRDIDDILRVLLPGGMIIESWLPKARVGDLDFDLRVMVIAGEARHLVVRQSRHPMTNLHLGSERGDIEAVEREHGARALTACRELAERAMACFPDTLYAGVDILLGRDGQPRVLEINAFGDLLPGLTHRGESTYEAIVSAALGARP